VGGMGQEEKSNKGRVAGNNGFQQTSFRIKQNGLKGGNGLAASSNGLRHITLDISCNKS
jgi:hypothetical protein